MLVLTLLNPKGGSGKTTLAAAIAVHATKAGRRVTLIDTDPQASLYQWSQRRSSEIAISAQAVPVTGLARQIGALKRGREFDLIVIDTHGSLTGIEPAVGHGDRVLIPIQPSGADLLELNKALVYCQRQSAIVAIVANRVKTQAERIEIAQSLTALAAGRASVCSVQIGDRVAYRSHFLSGMTAEEVGDRKAQQEIAQLCAELEIIT